MEGQSIIIKKVKKGGHGGHHGGGWKVAYADFMTAMMAFFLLMWLISMVAPEKRARISHYFKHFSIFEKGGSTFLDLNKVKPSVQLVENEGYGETQQGGEQSEPGSMVGKLANEIMTPDEVEQKLRTAIQQKLTDVKDQIVTKTFEGGLRIEVVDKEGNPLFPSGSSEMTASGKIILKVISDTIKSLTCKIALEGHTDARSYSSAYYSNWELSTERALSAKKEIERNGFACDRLIRVAGYAATAPFIRENPADPRNRRISIVLFSEFQYASSPPAALENPKPEPTAESRSMTAQQTIAVRPAPLPPERQAMDPIQKYLFHR